MCKKESFLDETINIISERTNEPKMNAAECLCQFFVKSMKKHLPPLQKNKVLLYLRGRWSVQSKSRSNAE
jgi:hypothetical protein